jgi:hypothetical protein
VGTDKGSMLFFTARSPEFIIVYWQRFLTSPHHLIHLPQQELAIGRQSDLTMHGMRACPRQNNRRASKGFDSGHRIISSIVSACLEMRRVVVYMRSCSCLLEVLAEQKSTSLAKLESSCLTRPVKTLLTCILSSPPTHSFTASQYGDQ